MSEPLPCPNCQTLLTLPAGAATVRCPNCQATLEVEPIDAPPPPPAPAAKAIPLPIGRPAPVPKAAPTAKPLPVGAKPAQKGRVVAEKRRDHAPPAGSAPVDPYAKATVGDEERQSRERRQDIERQLDELDQREAREEEEFEELDGQCAYARRAVALFQVAAYAGMAVNLIVPLFIATTMFSAAFLPLLGAALLASVVRVGASVAGFAAALSGPRAMRGTAGLGLGLSLGHALLGLGAGVMALFVAAGNLGLDNGGQQFVPSVVYLVNTASNATAVADLPIFVMGELPELRRGGGALSASGTWLAIALVVATALLDLGSAAAAGSLLDHYAAAAKDMRLAHDLKRTVANMFLCVFTLPVVRLIYLPLVPTELAWVPGLFGDVACCLWLAFNWYFMASLLNDLPEVLTAGRFLDKRAQIDY